MNLVSIDIKERLLERGLGYFVEADGRAADYAICISSEPATPDRVITIYDTGGPSPMECMDAGRNPIHQETFQIRVRGIGYLETRAKLDDIIWVLHRREVYMAANQFPGEPYMKYTEIAKQGAALPLPKDGKGRDIWTQNFRVFRHEMP